jgi:hypothetical protein
VSKSFLLLFFKKEVLFLLNPPLRKPGINQHAPMPQYSAYCRAAVSSAPKSREGPTRMYRVRLYQATAIVATALCIGNVPVAAAAPGEIVLQGTRGTIVVPASSVLHPEDAGRRAHTNIRLLIQKGHAGPQNTEPSGDYETPASLGCLYGVTKFVKGCNPETLKTVATGGSKAIALVDAYDMPTAAHDLGVYSKQFGLPAITKTNFQVVYATGSKPAQDPSGGWELEEALDIEMAHALAPNATVYLVEAASNNNSDLLVAESVAAKLVAAAGGGEVSNSWAGGEYGQEQGTEKNFSLDTVVFFASAGDSAGVGWPSVLDNVVAVGGTDVNRKANGNFENQSAWVDTGGGSSAYLARPAYQDKIEKIVGSKRGVPDISLVADPDTGVWMYDSTPYEGQVLDWLVVGGTSVASPASAAIVNNAAHFFGSSKLELTQVYKAKAKAKAFTDIVLGSCGANGKDTKAVKGWDFCTGVGTPHGTADK